MNPNRGGGELLLVGPADHRRMAWKNGLGVTDEIMAESAERPAWRLSLAEIDRPAPFSLFPNCDRLLLLLEGDGVELNVGGTRTVLSRPYEYLTFPGEQPVEAMPSGRSARVLNLIADRTRIRYAFSLLELDAVPAVRVVSGTILMHALEGSFELSRPALAPVLVAADHTFRFDQSGEGPIRISAAGQAAKVLFIELNAV